MQIVRTVTTAKPLEPVFAYLSDFTTTTEWDPATVQTFRSHGDGGIGSEYLNTSTFLGRQTRLTYVVEELVPNRRIRLRGQNKTIVAVDTMTFGTVPDGTEIIYIADFTFNGGVCCRFS